jgi:hypothetical protein
MSEPITPPTETAAPAPTEPKPNPFALLAAGKAPAVAPVAPEAPVPAPDPAAPPASDPAEEARTRSWNDILRRDREVTEAGAAHKADMRELEQLRAAAHLVRTDPLQGLRALGANETQVLDAFISRKEDPASSAQIDPRQLDQRFQSLEQKIDSREAERDQHALIAREVQRGDHEILRISLEEPGNTVYKDVLNRAAEEYHRLNPDGRTSRMPDYAAIVRAVEDDYTVKANALTDFLMRATKIKSRFAQTPPPATAPSPPAGSESAKRPTTATLSNDMNHTPPSTSTKPLTLEEKRARFNQAVSQMWKENKRH